MTALVTATAVLRLVAEGRFGLDDRANEHLRAVRLADDAITVRELLSHAGGVDKPPELYADSVPDLAELMGPVISCGGPRGTIRPGNGGYAVLGQLIADVTGMPYASAATRSCSSRSGCGTRGSPPARRTSVPARSPATRRRGRYLRAVPGPDSHRAGPSAGSGPPGPTWCAWPPDGPRCCPRALAREALTAQAEPEPGGYRVGLGWLLPPGDQTAVHSGVGLEATAFLRIRDPRPADPRPADQPGDNRRVRRRPAAALLDQSRHKSIKETKSHVPALPGAAPSCPNPSACPRHLRCRTPSRSCTPAPPPACSASSSTSSR